MDQFIEDLTCSVCFNIYEDPRLLKCSHTFCRNCLENILRSSESYLWRHSAGRLKCPSCRGVTDLSIGVHCLPVNFALQSIVEKYKTSNPSSARTCPQHNEKPLNLFCLKDRRLICCQCNEFGHKNHPTEDLETAYRKERKTAGKLLTTLQKKNFTSVSTTIGALEGQLEECQTIIQEDKKEVVAFFNNLIDVFEQKKQNLLASLNDLNQKIVDTYAPKIEEMKQIQDEELDLLSLASTTLDEESPLVYLKNIHTIEQGIETLKNQKFIPIYPVEMQPRFGQILKDHILKARVGDIQRQTIPTVEFVQVKPRSRNMLACTSLVALFVFVLIVLFSLLRQDSIFQYITSCWSHFLKIAEPFLSFCGIQAFTAMSTSQTLTILFHDFTNYLYSFSFLQ